MKRLAIITAAVFLMAFAGYAACGYQHARHVEYWQYDPLCLPNGSCAPRWFLRGTCDTDCDGNTTCSGDTHIDDQTHVYVTNIECPACDPPPM
jgi:hypothetical protein